eukprot:361803-Heterocapsa_arctica.AAC.1
MDWEPERRRVDISKRKQLWGRKREAQDEKQKDGRIQDTPSQPKGSSSRGSEEPDNKNTKAAARAAARARP